MSAQSQVCSRQLHPYLFNTGCVKEFVTKLRGGVHVEPPRILVELYLKDCPEFAAYKGTNNSLSEDTPGISLAIELDYEAFGEEYRDYIADPKRVTGVPVEYY